jgi:hypothetical protein
MKEGSDAIQLIVSSYKFYYAVGFSPPGIVFVFVCVESPNAPT